MDRLYHSPLFDHIRKYFESNPDETLFLFVPYVKVKILTKLLDGITNKTVIVTTWNPMDVLFGSSDLELWPFCKEHGIALYVSENMHLKIYSAGLNSAILATGNVSHNGLEPDGNYEAATIIESMSVQDKLFFERIRKEARLVDDKLYEDLKKWSEDNKIDLPKRLKLSEIASPPKKDDFSVAALPMTRRVEDLVLGYRKIASGLEPSDDSETSACIFHDLINYDMAKDLSETEFVQELSAKFFSHPFIRRIDEFIAPEAHFGRIKEWIQDNCTDVPVPSRRELTGNVQVLLEWFERLGDGKYKIDVPGRHSQRIKKL